MKNRTILKLVAFTFIILSCSTMSKNFIKKGSLQLNGGVYLDKQWSDSLFFKRVSWHQELTLLFDLLSTRVDKKSSFHYWFSKHEQEAVAQCGDFLVVLSYALDSERISTAMFVEQMQYNGYERISIPHFAASLKLHPDFERHSLKLYRIYGLCKKHHDQKSIIVSFPSFNNTRI